MTLHRRLLVLLVIAVPLVWGVAVGTSLLGARREVNELFDSYQVLVARQLLGLVSRLDPHHGDYAAMRKAAIVAAGSSQAAGGADLEDFAITIRDASGKLRYADREEIELPAGDGSTGFRTTVLRGEPWRIYQMSTDDSAWHVAVGQVAGERGEVMKGLVAGQLLPWVLMLPVLLVAMSLAIRHALRPVRELARHLGRRNADDLGHLECEHLPAEMRPLIESMNGLLTRLREALEHERRLTSDAAHELRTPLAAVRSQWEAMLVATGVEARSSAQRNVGDGIRRLERVATQLLALAGIDARDRHSLAEAIDWQQVIQEVISGCLPLIEQVRGEVSVDWPLRGRAPLPVAGERALVSVLLRNLVDNALRYAGPEPQVLIRLTEDAVIVEDAGDGVDPAALSKLGLRFFRASSGGQTGSGLGLSIVLRIAELHGLAVRIENRASPGHGLRVTLTPRPAQGASASMRSCPSRNARAAVW